MNETIKNKTMNTILKAEGQRWYSFDKSKGSNQKRPEIKKYVLVQMRSNDPQFPDPIVVGYRKDASGDKQCPYFVTPGAVGHGDVYRWCDCLPDNFNWPTKSDGGF